MSLASFDLTGRVALVTGSGRGIGLAVAHGLAAAGARIVLNARDASRLETAASALAAAGAAGPARAAFDVTDPEAVAAGIAKIEREVGPIAILVNNAGIQHRTPLEEFPVADWNRVLRTNLDSAFFVGQAAARAMIPRGKRRDHQHLLGAERARPPRHHPLHRLQGRPEDADQGHGRRVGKARHPRQRHRPRLLRDRAQRRPRRRRGLLALGRRPHPARPLGEVEELAGAAVFLASDAASFVTGHILYVDGGMTSVLSTGCLACSQQVRRRGRG